MRADAPLLEVRDLSVRYGEATVLDRVGFTVDAGEILGVTGESASGKSSLALALLGLVRGGGTMSSGALRLAGFDLARLDEAGWQGIRGREIGLIVQNPRAALNPMLTVGRQIGRVWSAHRGGRGPAAAARAVEMLKLVGINDAERRAAAYAHELSGGMAQRVLIAAALAAEPRLLVADEPTSGLDVTVQAQFLDWMWRTVKQRQTAMVLITQEPGILANYCDRVLSLAHGRIAGDESAQSHFARHRTARSIVPRPVADSAPVLRAEKLFKTFPVRGSTKRVQAVNDVSLEVAVGETLGLVGESGSGKTTVGRCLVRLEEASAGSIVAVGRDLAALRGADLRRVRTKLQIVRQDPFDSFDPRWTMSQSVAEPLLAVGPLDAAARQARVAWLFERVGVDRAMMSARPGDLSAGILQRLAIARALAAEPKLIVLDEPTSVLPPSARREIVQLLQEIQAATGVAYIFISHDLTTVASLSHRVAVMYLGQIVETGTTAQVFHAPAHPYTRALMAAHLEESVERRRPERGDLETLEGEIPSPIDLPSGCFLASRCSYRRPRCSSESQTLSRAADGRLVRCWRASDIGSTGETGDAG